MRKMRRRRKNRKRLLSMTLRPWTLTKIVGEVGARLRKGIGKRKETEIDIEIIGLSTFPVHLLLSGWWNLWKHLVYFIRWPALLWLYFM
jgi:hypothetical protein